MDEAAQRELFTKLGEISATLEGMKETQGEQNKTMKDLDTRLRKQEIKSAGISLVVAAVFSAGLEYIKKGFNG